MFSCYVAVSFIDPLLLYCGGELTSSIFGFGSRWPLGNFMAAALVGAAGFITIVGRERTSLSVDVLAITAWLLLGQGRDWHTMAGKRNGLENHFGRLTRADRSRPPGR
jgi:hypothetical protein